MSQTAILIDFENLIIGVENNDPEAQKTFSIKKILQFVDKNYGHVTFKKAFADWSNQKFRKYAQDMMRNGIEMQHIVRSCYGNKNFNESHMTIAAMDCISRNPMVDTIVLATGDADFLPLINHLKATGRQVLGIGAEGTVSASVLASCDEYLYYAQDGLYKAHVPSFDKAGIYKLLRNIIGTNGIYVADIEDEILAQYPDFNLDELGYGSIMDLLQSMPNAVRIDETGDEPKAFWNTQPPRQTRYSKNEVANQDLANMPLEEYMHTTRWYITDGPIREAVLTNIFNVLSTAEHLISSEDLREMTATGDLAVEDKEWQGTIYSLVCGACLWQKPENNDVPVHLYKLSLFKNIENMEDFLLGYYVSLFHKAYMHRPDLNPQTMAELMHPEAPEQHLPLFEKVYAEISSRTK